MLKYKYLSNINIEGDFMKTYLYNNQNMPTYIGVYNALYSDIMNGVYPPNEILPGEITLAEKYGVSRNTLRQALAILHEDGMIIKSQGKGTIVTSHPKKSFAEYVTNPLLSMSKHPITDTILTYNYGCPTEIAKDKLKLSQSDIVLACNCVFKSNDCILGYSFTQVPATYFEMLGLDTSKENSIREVILDTLFQYSKKINMTVKLIYANEIEIEFLQIPQETPLLLIEALHYDKSGHPLARNKFYVIPEHYHLTFDFVN